MALLALLETAARRICKTFKRERDYAKQHCGERQVANSILHPNYNSNCTNPQLIADSCWLPQLFQILNELKYKKRSEKKGEKKGTNCCGFPEAGECTKMVQCGSYQQQYHHRHEGNPATYCIAAAKRLSRINDLAVQSAVVRYSLYASVCLVCGSVWGMLQTRCSWQFDTYLPLRTTP